MDGSDRLSEQFRNNAISDRTEKQVLCSAFWPPGSSDTTCCAPTDPTKHQAKNTRTQTQIFYVVPQNRIGGPTWPVLTGRRDGNKSLDKDALTGLPGTDMNITQLKAKFVSVGLSVKDLAVLSGGHTIGVSHCSSFAARLYYFPSKNGTDPSLHPSYVAKLKKQCPPADLTSIVEMDPGSFRTFDTHYYSGVGKRKGMFPSDGALLTDSTTLAYVQAQASPQSSTFLTDFGQSMMNMGKIGVLTGTSGTIRKQCAIIN